MLGLVNIGKAEPKPTASATNETFMQAKQWLEEVHSWLSVKSYQKSEQYVSEDGFEIHIYGTLSPDCYRSWEVFTQVCIKRFKQAMTNIYLSS